jgi:hypothetical protein
MTAKKTAAGTPPANEQEGTQEVKPKGLDLSKFNYERLEGDSFKEYMKLVGNLNENELHNFEVYNCTPIRKARFAGMRGTPYDVVGLETVGKPIKTTRISTRDAKLFNGVLVEEGVFFTVLGGHWIATGETNGGAIKGKYYLLKK